MLVFLATMTFGVIGYMIIEEMSLFDAFYMTVITISTVGFMEVKNLSTPGRVVTLFVIFSGLTVGAYALGNLFRFFIEGEMQRALGRRRLEKEINQIKDHYVICGFGRIGSMICNELDKHGKKFVVIENDPEGLEYLKNSNYLYVAMDATDEEALVQAGIERASALVTAVKSDADNVFITLTAKGLKPDLYILARSSDSRNDAKLKRAGATNVVSPYQIGGLRMAQVLLRPTVVDFIDSAMMESKFGLRMEEARISEGSVLVGKNLMESNIRKDYGVIIVLIKKESGEMIFGPAPQVILDSGDVVVMMGNIEMLEKLEQVM